MEISKKFAKNIKELAKSMKEFSKEKYVIVKVSEIQELIAMLSTDGKGTKQEVKKKLEEIVQWKEKN